MVRSCAYIHGKGFARSWIEQTSRGPFWSNSIRFWLEPTSSKSSNVDLVQDMLAGVFTPTKETIYQRKEHQLKIESSLMPYKKVAHKKLSFLM